MTQDVRRQCVVCAWRRECTKKHTIKPTALHCPDYCRDEALGPEVGETAPAERHKRIDDIFGRS